MDTPGPYGLEPPVMPVDGPPQAVPGADPATASARETPTGRKAHAASGARSVVLAAAVAGVGGLVGGMIFASPKGSTTSTTGSNAANARDDAGTSSGAIQSQRAPSFDDGGRGYSDDDGGSTWTPPSDSAPSSPSDRSAVPPSGNVSPQFGGPGGMTTSRGS